RALGYYHQSDELFQRIGEKVGECSVLEGMAFLYSALGEKEKALRYYLEALSLAKQTEDIGTEGETLDFISEIYRDLGNYTSALDFSERAVLVYKSLPSILGESYGLA